MSEPHNKWWTPALAERAVGILRGHHHMPDALAALSKAFGRTITKDGVGKALRTFGHAPPSHHLRPRAGAASGDVDIPIEVDEQWDDKTDPAIDLPEPEQETEEPKHPQLAALAKLAKKWSSKGGLTLEALCDELHMTPKAGRALAAKAIEAGYHVDIRGNVLDFRPPETLEPKEVVLDTPSLALGEEIAVGVVSDPHFASKHHERDALKRHVEWLYESGVRHFFGPGDWVAGGYSFLKYEVTHTGIEDQAGLVADFIKEVGPEITWMGIAGNHCTSFNVGINAAKMIEQMLRSDGWNNFHYLGERAALVRLHNTRFGLHHPGGGLGYAISYKLQKYVDEQPPHRRAQFLFTGHTHQALYMRRGGCHSFLCGTFENGDSGFGRMLGGDVAVGGWLVRYRLDERGEVATVVPEFRRQPCRGMQFVQVPA